MPKLIQFGHFTLQVKLHDDIGQLFNIFTIRQ